MKDSRFIELLNLYVDHQISAADAALLEAEIQRTPERRKVYRQYCQMQKACMTLSETFLAEIPSVAKVLEISPKPSPRRLAAATYAMAFAAAAACVALVVVNRSSPSAPGELSAPAIVAAAPVAESVRPTLQPAFAVLAKDEARSSSAAASSSASLDWMNNVQVQRVSAEDLWFDSRPTLETHDLTLRSARPYQGQVETTAFIFPK